MGRILLSIALIILLSLRAVESTLFAVGPHPSLPSPGVTDGLGVNIHFTNAQPGEMEMLAEAGFRWIRMDVTWGRTERERGRYDFSAYDRLLDDLDQHGIGTLLILDYSNTLYEKDRSVATEEGRLAYARWAAAATNHFKGRGIIWEIWNEPNIRGFWRPEPNLDDYTAMAIAACEAIHDVAPNEAIVGPATSQIDLEFLEGCFRAGLLEHWAAVSVHPYRQNAPETVAAEYRKLRQLISRYTPEGKRIPILAAEWGYSAAWHSCDEVQQGKLLPRQWLTNMAAGVPISIWYDWHDDGGNPDEAEHNFGTVAFAYHTDRQPVYDPKPAYHAAKTLTSSLAGFHFIKRIGVGSPNDYAMLFGKDQQLRVAVWTTDDQPRRITLPSDATVFQVVTHTGEREADIHVTDGKLEIMIDDAPHYLAVDLPNPKLVSAPVAYPMYVKMEPALDSTLTVRVENTSGKAFRGKAKLTHVEGVNPVETTRLLRFDTDQMETTLTFPISQEPSGLYQVGLHIADAEGRVILNSPPQRVAPLPMRMLLDTKVIEDGDHDVACEYSRIEAPPPEPLPGFNGPVAKLTYRFAEGWKFLRLAIDGQTEIEGIPKTLGLWIYGDGRLGSPRLRIRDVSGETWQPSGPQISWTGWRYVEIPLNGSAGCWGGDENRQLDPPLRWDTIFLLDSPARKSMEGEIYLAAPHLMY
ncbi:cellulase family glycosylhydrolase [Novipirellula artificiosorum]|uniref:Glycoside hydrolase family 5 domain-containing protein n=1 Tax=Novipirellula artificiosorum TaxID=2528016 RepID=A0A5C6DN25_9BACT|nr:cellulase family glycosylhydrolase [Novipirellula artificiosorum]TWU38240.1 hypothetical protein Poly41_27160 [Novipirellula artificiosorum]